MNYLRAAKSVCAYALDRDDAVLILSMLGLYDGENIVEPEVPVGMFYIHNPKSIPIGRK